MYNITYDQHGKRDIILTVEVRTLTVIIIIQRWLLVDLRFKCKFTQQNLPSVILHLHTHVVIKCITKGK